ncbi:MAG: hypothetical protein FGM24_10600 [Candidatus Kapabacteria bacterium]|nr:hypothetical protein [Candidatus Kapabacteria bacterium]
MSRSPGPLLIGYGMFLVVAGIVGYAATHATSTSALLNGGIFGALMIVMGVVMRMGRMWTYPAAMSASVIFTITFAWRGALQWHTVIGGESERLPVAMLLTVMFIVSGIVSSILVRGYRH